MLNVVSIKNVLINQNNYVYLLWLRYVFITLRHKAPQTTFVTLLISYQWPSYNSRTCTIKQIKKYYTLVFVILSRVLIWIKSFFLRIQPHTIKKRCLTPSFHPAILLIKSIVKIYYNYINNSNLSTQMRIMIVQKILSNYK